MPDRPRYVAAGAAAPESPLAAANGELESAQALADAVRFDDNGLIPAIVQDIETDAVLTLAYMNRLALDMTLQTGQTHFWSRSRQELWHKGATSGNYQHVFDISIDCDGDALLVRVRPEGPACHTGAYTCFYRTFANEADTASASAGEGPKTAKENN